jgi:hypothetical protein
MTYFREKPSFQYSNIPSFRYEAKIKASKKLIHSIVCRNSETLNYLKRAGRKSAVHEDPAEYVTGNQNDADNSPAADN